MESKKDIFIGLSHKYTNYVFRADTSIKDCCWSEKMENIQNIRTKNGITDDTTIVGVRLKYGQILKVTEIDLEPEDMCIGEVDIFELDNEPIRINLDVVESIPSNDNDDIEYITYEEVKKRIEQYY
tara:strand:- start:149 stop:526 length:378 start_codon:yes stop_codon:yes gene_type:complete